MSEGEALWWVVDLVSGNPEAGVVGLLGGMLPGNLSVDSKFEAKALMGVVGAKDNNVVPHRQCIVHPEVADDLVDSGAEVVRPGDSGGWESVLPGCHVVREEDLAVGVAAGEGDADLYALLPGGGNGNRSFMGVGG